MTTAQDIIKAAMSIAKDVTAAAEQGRFDPADLNAELVVTCRELFGTVAGEGDPLWPLHVDIARQVLALDGVSADELSEWLAVLQRRAEGDTALQGPDIPAQTESPASGSHSPQIEGIEPDPEPEADQ
ncbi:hypothetical protein MSIMFI_04907 [Mycobacterium simulans]|uniref:flagellar hook-length control protein n=1 Tax=Mycobacterium simulans TaxID=627089 RepID=UPI00174A160C|nr:flagellar hook-length control protein [Mycobacterium simulans]SON63377.1 hypothetical protein MSIMFI_04907 [Mycobacterium simulans]